MIRKPNLILVLVILIVALLAITSCTAEQQAQNAATNAVNATADAARLKVNQFTGYAQSMVDQLAAQAGDTPTSVADANEIKYALDDVNAKLQGVINALENDKHTALRGAEKAVEQALDIVKEIATKAEDPEILTRLNDIVDGLEEIQQGLVDLVNE